MALAFAVTHLYIFLKLLLSIPFFILKKNLMLMNGRTGPRYQRVLALCAFFDRSGAEGTSSSNILCLMFVYVLLCM